MDLQEQTHNPEGPAEELEKEHDRYLRLMSVFDFFRRRTSERCLEAGQRGKRDLLLGLLDVADDFERALQSGENGAASARPVYEHLLSIFSANGLQRIETEGMDFDPAVHEAVMTEDDFDFLPGTIIREIRSGWTLDGKLLRPARVSVAE